MLISLPSRTAACRPPRVARTSHRRARRRALLQIAAAALLLAPCAPALGQDHDLAILNGRTIDPETGLDAIRNVGVKDGKISAITTEAISGAKTIDADGLIVSPGFIDIHSHAVVDLPANRMQAHDGVTTALELESGLGPIGAWYDAVAEEGRATNYGAAVSWSFARIAAMIPEMPPMAPTAAWYQAAFAHPRWTTDVSTPEELDRIVAMIEQGLDEGALGIGVNSGYVPGVGGKELLRIWKIAAARSVPVSTHMRNWSQVDPNSTIEGLNMVVGLAATSGARTNICHLHSTNLHDTLAARDLVRAARDLGIDVHTEVYPYGIATMPIASSVLLLEGDVFRDRMGVDFDAVRLIARGRDIKDEADMRSEQARDPGQLIIMKFLDEAKTADEEILNSVVATPWIAIASDAVPWNSPDGGSVQGTAWPLPEGSVSNPRSAGTFARFLGRWVREKGLLGWPEAIAKVTLIPAKLFDGMTPAMERKGRLQVGLDADITVFDPATILDRATVDQPAQTSAGIEFVVVDGKVVIEGGVLNVDVLPGKPIRNAVTP